MSDEIIETPVIEQAASTPETVETPKIETEAIKEEVNTQADEKKFTQAEINVIIQKEKARASAIAERRALKVYADKLEKMTAQPVQKQDQVNDGRPRIEHYGNDVESYVEAVSDWKNDKRDRETQAQQADFRKQVNFDKTEKIYKEAAALDKTFNREDFDSIEHLTGAIADAIIDSDMSAKLLIHFANNPSDVERISQLSPARQAAEVGKLEVQLLAAKPVKVSNAPAPIEPVGSRGSSSKDPSQMSDKEFATWRKSQIAQRGR